MTKHASIIIADETALFVYMHISSPDRAGIAPTRENPLSRCASTAEELRRFNSDHPFYGGHPISVLVRKAAARRQSSKLKCRYCDSDLPAGSFFKLREGLYIASPELVFLRMADLVSEIRLIEIGINLCGRYYISLDTGKIDDRDGMLTSPAKLAKYLEKARGIRGARKAEKALRWVLANSGSPAETKMAIQFTLPKWKGGLGLPFTHLNYDVSAGRLTRFTEQGEFCLDCANPKLHVGTEYDGKESHQDTGKDIRRRNALAAMGWRVFPMDKSVLYNSEKTIHAGLQIAKHINMRVQWPTRWEERYAFLRRELDLPC